MAHHVVDDVGSLPVRTTRALVEAEGPGHESATRWPGGHLHCSPGSVVECRQPGMHRCPPEGLDDRRGDRDPDVGIPEPEGKPRLVIDQRNPGTLQGAGGIRGQGNHVHAGMGRQLPRARPDPDEDGAEHRDDHPHDRVPPGVHPRRGGDPKHGSTAACRDRRGQFRPSSSAMPAPGPREHPGRYPRPDQ